MIVTCEKCHRRYNLQEDKLRGDARRVRCRNCKSLITLPLPEPEAPAQAAKGHATPTPTTPAAAAKGHAAPATKGPGAPAPKGPAAPALKAPVAPTPKGPAAPALKAPVAPTPKGPAAPAPKGPVAPAPKGRVAPTPKSPAAPTPKVPAPPTPKTRQWYAMVQGERTGPLSDDALAAKSREGEVTSQTFVWHRGMADWKRAGDVAEASSLIAAGGTTPFVAPAPALQTSTTPPQAGTSPDRGVISPGGEAEEPQLFLASAFGRRHPHWKFAPVLVVLVALPLMLVFMFSGPPLPTAQGPRPDEGDREQTGSASSRRGSRIGDVLLGRRSGQHGSPAGGRRGAAEPPLLQKAGPPGASASNAKPVDPAPTAKPGEGFDPLPSTGGAQPELNALYGDGTHTDIGPRVRKGEDEKGKDTTVGGLGQKEVAKVVSRAQPAFQFCIEQELKKNPKFRGGKIFITATIGGSGIVKKAEVDRPEINSSPLGECLKGKARRMVFPAFSGDETEIQIPLILGATM